MPDTQDDLNQKKSIMERIRAALGRVAVPAAKASQWSIAGLVIFELFHLWQGNPAVLAGLGPVVGMLFETLKGEVLGGLLGKVADAGDGVSDEQVAGWVDEALQQAGVNDTVQSDRFEVLLDALSSQSSAQHAELMALLEQMQAVLTQTAGSDRRLRQILDRLEEMRSATYSISGDYLAGDKIGQNKVEAETILSVSNIGHQNVIAQGDNGIAIGDRGTAARDVSGVVITGDNNHVHQIIRSTNIRLAPEEMREQIGNYLKWLIEMTGTIELRGIRRQGEQVVQLDLNTIYVPLSAKGRLGDWGMGRYGDEMGLGEGDFTLDQLLKLGKRQIISGGPGSGKTTVLLHLAWAMGRALLLDEPTFAEAKIGHKAGAPLLFPILVPLSRYAAHLRKLKTAGVQDPNESTLANFISRYLIEMQAGVSLPRDFYDQLLRDGRQILLLLDGLDEVPTEEERILVRSAIETLVSGREQLNVIVTCRTAAYQGRVALGKGFREIEVLPLKKAHLRALIYNAYRAIESNGERADQRARELIDSIDLLETERRRRIGERAEALVVSPLLVRMLLIVHVSERRLPDRRAELYQKATEALISPDYSVDEHVAQEITRFVGDFSKHLSLVQYLAFHMHQRGDEQGREIEEDDLRDLLDEPAAGLREQRRPFLTTTRERGTLMEERLGLYRFIHLSFQEFLVARYIAEVIRDDGGQAAMLDFVLEDERLLDSWWREPILLIIGYLSIDKHTSATRFASSLLNLYQTHPDLHPDLHWAAAELAATAVNEWTDADPALKEAAASAIVGLIGAHPQEQPVSQPILRAGAGVALAHIGDPRPGVVDIDRLPFTYVPPGPFMMGEGREDKIQYQQDCLDYGYWLAVYPVTFGHFQTFVDEEGYFNQAWWGEAEAAKQWTPKGYQDRYHAPRVRGEANEPVRGVSWYEGMAFCRWLSARWERQLPVGYQLRLPTIAEWEKGARGGLEIPNRPIIKTISEIEDLKPVVVLNSNPIRRRSYPWGDEVTLQHANIVESRIENPSSVGLFSRGETPYGCQDLIGIVYEWTTTRSGDVARYAVDGRDQLARKSGERTFLMGGSWYNKRGEYYVKCGGRHWSYPVDLYVNFGFRIVLSPLAL